MNVKKCRGKGPGDAAAPYRVPKTLPAHPCNPLLLNLAEAALSLFHNQVFLERPEGVGGFSRLSFQQTCEQARPVYNLPCFSQAKANPNYGSSAIGCNLGGKCSASRWASFPFLNRNLRNPQLFHNLMRIKLLNRNREEGNTDASAICAVLSMKNSEEAEPITWQEGTKF
jgi:hypothetical protein